MSAIVNSGEAKIENYDADDAKEEHRKPFLKIGDTQVYFSEDWATGIGGGLWSTGLAMARYFGTPHAASTIQRLQSQKRKKDGLGLSVLELGSGNGFLSVCLLALARDSFANLVVTDFEDHLSMIRQTLAANSHITQADKSSNNNGKAEVPVHVMEHMWGEFPSPTVSAIDAESADANETYESMSLPDRVHQGKHKFDLIIGSDVAYRKELYDPLISSLLQFCHAQTVCLIGMTMADTTPSFFTLLTKAGFVYERFADHLLHPEFRGGKTFGVFVIRKKQ
jgi:predicted nicotinamide N-methyase